MKQTIVRASQLIVERGDVSLACIDSGPADCPSVLLLHGLAGHMGEWLVAAASLERSYRVARFDQRGHGASTRAPSDLSRAAFVADTIAVIEKLELAPVVLVGQSLGAHTAFLVAAERPDLVAGLLVAETSPERDPFARARLAVLLRAWPVPFTSRATALEFFGGDSLAATFWLDGLEERAGAWWPRFECQVVLGALREVTERSFWSEWERVRAPTLIVRGEAGSLDGQVAKQMLERGAVTELVEIAGGGHDIHLEQPQSWLGAVHWLIETIGVGERRLAGPTGHAIASASAAGSSG